MSGPLPVRDFAASANPAADMRAHYLASRARLEKRDPKPSLSLPERREVSTIPPPDYVITRDAYARVAAERRDEERIHRPILRAVSVVCGVAINDILGQSRKLRPTKARMIAYHLVQRELQCAVDTGRRLRRDHSTILHGLARVERVIAGLSIEVCDDPVELCGRLWAADWRAVR